MLLYQTLLGSWPLEPLDEHTRPVYVQRIQDYMVKALHEAKVNSSWIEPNEAWDKAVCDFVAKILEPGPSNRFLPTFTPFAERLATAGMVNSLAQTALKLTVPGMPDFYQGSELWDLSLVDPDNRRPVDYGLRRKQLTAISGEVSRRHSWKIGATDASSCISSAPCCSSAVRIRRSSAREVTLRFRWPVNSPTARSPSSAKSRGQHYSSWSPD
ncbi:MAG: hypothetical protein WDN28_32410 [Chthoniobacter sp.]